MSFMCGSFKTPKEDDFEALWPSPLTKSRRHKFCCKRKKENNKNPYANRGLDKFEALLAELDDKKRKIFIQKGSQYISFVRFVYSNSNDVTPIIVKLRDHPRKHDKDKDHHHKQNNIKTFKSTLSLPKLQVPTLDHNKNSELVSKVTKGIKIEAKEAHLEQPSIDKVTKMIRVNQWKQSLKSKLEEWWMPSYNLPLFVILVMLFLIFFGRSLAIICASIAWYVIPNIDGTLEINATMKKMIKQQHDFRKPSENKVVSSPRGYFSGPINVQQNNKMKKLMSF